MAPGRLLWSKALASPIGRKPSPPNQPTVYSHLNSYSKHVEVRSKIHMDEGVIAANLCCDGKGEVKVTWSCETTWVRVPTLQPRAHLVICAQAKKGSTSILPHNSYPQTKSPAIATKTFLHGKSQRYSDNLGAEYCFASPYGLRHFIKLAWGSLNRTSFRPGLVESHATTWKTTHHLIPCLKVRNTSDNNLQGFKSFEIPCVPTSNVR
jgi:hypothetical protein